MREVVIDALEIRDDRTAERGDSVEDEEIRVTARREFVIEEDVDPLRVAGPPRHLPRQTVGGCGTGSHNVRFIGAKTAVEDDRCSGSASLLEQAAIECAFFRAAPDEPAIWLAAANRARVAPCIVERRPIRRAEIEVALDSDAIEKVGHRLALGRRLDDLQVADEARSHIGFRFMHFNRSSGTRENDCRSETGGARAGDADRAVILHSRGMLSRHVGNEFR